MLNESGALLDDDRKPSRQPADGDDYAQPIQVEMIHIALRETVQEVMHINSAEFPEVEHPMQARGDLMVMNPQSALLAVFRGQLSLESEAAYDRLDAMLENDDLLPMFRRENDEDVIYIIEGRTHPADGGKTLSLVLFVLTVFSVLYVGTLMSLAEMGGAEAIQMANNPIPELWRGLPYAVSILLILGAHEMGHYLASRWHKVAASLPYFIPFPFGLFGTFGAAIRLREPMRNRKMLLDIGAAGPLAGMVFALPILFIGLATSDVGPVSVGGLTEGNSILYALAKVITFGRFLPQDNMDVFVNQLAWAGWTGLFVTGLNLIPLGQLDGGHVMYSLIGDNARKLYWPAILLMGVLIVFTNSALILLLIMLVLLGRVHATPLDNITPLDNRRKLIAAFTLIIFVLVFVPVPLTQNAGEASNLIPGQNAQLFFLTLWLSR